MNLLEDYDRDAGDSYYRAVLQNLFFATLNTEIGKRKFSEGGNPRHRNFSLYRYKDQITDPDKLLEPYLQKRHLSTAVCSLFSTARRQHEMAATVSTAFSAVDYDTGEAVPNRLFFDEGPWFDSLS